MAQYDPNKKYTWGPEDKFELNGKEFGLILNTFRSILGTEEASKILLVHQANQSIEAVIAKGVEAGIVKEVVLDENTTPALTKV
tara:strand:- start:45749 stop:46000 length:252 start_codon:yes stop_codon:yes gene_type:complete